MKPLKSFFFLSLLFCSQAFASSRFDSLLTELNLTFEMPEDYMQVPVKENRDLFYDFAMKHKKVDLEVRYSFFPLKSWLEDYQESLKDSTRTMINPNELYKSLILVNILNIAQLQLGKDPLPGVTDFAPKAVKAEFGCEYGATAFFKANSSYSEGYKYCSMVYLHKENVADVTICFLVKKPKVFEKYFEQAFYALRFNAEE